MILRFRSVAMVVASAGYAHAAANGDDKAQLLIGSIPTSAWVRPALVTAAAQIPARTAPSLAGFLPLLPSSFLGNSDGSSRLLFLSPLSPLRAALRVAAQDLANRSMAPFESPRLGAADREAVVADEMEATEAAASASAAARRREVILRQRRKSVLNERTAGDDRSTVVEAIESDLGVSGLSGRVELLTLPANAVGAPSTDQGSIPNGAGLVRLSGNLTDDLSFAVTGLAADSAATTWRAGAEFELKAGDRNHVEVGAIYGTRFNATNTPIGGEIDRRSVGAFRLIHAMKLFDSVTTRAGGRFIEAPFLRSPHAFDPEFSVLIETPENDQGRSYLRLEVSRDTLFPGLEVVTGESDLIALSEGLPLLARDFEAQRTWSRGIAVGYRAAGNTHGDGTRLEAGILDQAVTHALFLLPSSVAGAPFARNGSRSRVQVGSILIEKTFGDGQAQAGLEYGYGRFAVNRAVPDRTRGFHQLTSRFDAYLRRTGTGVAVFHRFHEGAAVLTRQGDSGSRMRAQRYLVELRQDVPFVPSLIGADMAVLVSLRNVYYDDVDRRNIDEFAVTAPPRRVTGGIRVKF